jgi:cysteine synthase
MARIDPECRTQVFRSLNTFSPFVRVPDWVIQASLGDIPESKLLEVFILPLQDGDGGNGKRFSAHQLCINAEKEGRIHPGSTVLLPGSGNTGVNIAYGKDAYGLEKVIAIIDPISVPESKVAQLIMAGAKIAYPREKQTTLELAQELEDRGLGVFMNQYKEKGGPEGQLRTMNYIISEMESMDEDLSFFACAAGSTAMLCAAGERLPDAFPNVHIIGGIYEKKEEPVPGARTLEAIKRDISFDWRKVVDPLGLLACDQFSAFNTNRILNSATRRLFGPTCGLALEAGVRRFRYFAERKELEQFINPHGKYPMVVTSMDMSLGYPQEYMKVLPLMEEALFRE